MISFAENFREVMMQVKQIRIALYHLTHDQFLIIGDLSIINLFCGCILHRLFRIKVPHIRPSARNAPNSLSKKNTQGKKPTTNFPNTCPAIFT